MSSPVDVHSDVLLVLAQRHALPIPSEVAAAESTLAYQALQLAVEMEERCGTDARLPYRALVAKLNQLNTFFKYQPGSGENLYVWDRIKELRPVVEAKRDILTRFNEIQGRFDPSELAWEEFQALEVSLWTHADNLARRVELVSPSRSQDSLGLRGATPAELNA